VVPAPFVEPLLRITETREGSTLTLSLSGELDLATRERVEAALTRAVTDPGVTRIVLDLSGLTFMDSSGVHLALQADERCRAVSRRLLVVAGSDHTRRIFQLTRTDGLLEFLDGPV
jgi:anti-sigma B factor antagonist